MRAVSILQVADPSIWMELEASFSLKEHIEAELDSCRRVVRPSFEKVIVPDLRPLIRYPHRTAEEQRESTAAIAETVLHLAEHPRRCLVSAQRHAVEGVVYARHAWDPVADVAAVRELLVRELVSVVQTDDEPGVERYRLHPDLPAPPRVLYEFSEALMPEPDDLEPSTPGPMGLLEDMASLAAALEHVRPKVAVAGTVVLADARKVGSHLGDPGVARDGLEKNARWGRALRGLQALRMVSVDLLSRGLQLDLALETVLEGRPEDAVDRLVHRLVDADLHSVLPALREALRQAGNQAIDEMIFLEALCLQHREVLITPWVRGGRRIYPTAEGATEYPFDADGFERFEEGMVRGVLARMARFGLIRRAPGVFSATSDGRAWAEAEQRARPPIWVSGDLEIIVPPGALTPWERFQVERLGRCLQRDVVDRFRMEPEKLRTWLGTHEVSEALSLLERRCPGVPQSARDALESWAKQALRVTLTRGVLLGDAA